MVVWLSRVLTVSSCWLVGCGAVAEPAPAPVGAASEPGTAGRSAIDGGRSSRAVDGAPDAGAEADRGAGDAGAAEAGARACPDGMVVVDGDYCTELEMHCLKSWYAESNRKVICERFEEPTQCVGDRVHKRFCIDLYEFPNEKGRRPEVMNNFYQAQIACAARGKRVCTESEWTMACEGPAFKPYPYGYARDATKCLGDRPYGFPNKTKIWARDAAELERLWQGVESGSQPACVSDFGVFDLPGNADELAASERMHDGKFDNVTTGGPWYLGVRNQCRPKIYDHDESFAYYYLSFRCCAETDGAPTDPRAPKQIARGWDFERVRQIAATSLDLKPREWGGHSPAH